jgi:hypothetical protein
MSERGAQLSDHRLNLGAGARERVDAVAAALLRGIQRTVGLAYQLLGLNSIAGQHGQAKSTTSFRSI